jgi:L-malate glycosyltransferase
MRVLVLTNMFPTQDRPFFGIFVKEQVGALQQRTDTVSIDCLALTQESLFVRYFLSAFNILRKLKSYQPNVIHVHFGLTFLPLLFLYPYLKVKQIKIITTFHGSDILGKSRLCKLVSWFAVRCSDAVIAVSRDIAKKINQNQRVEHIPCGVTAEFSKLASKKPREAEDVVVFPSSPSRAEKDYPRFLAVVSEAEKVLQKKLKVQVLENKTRAEVVSIFKQSRCLVLTSKYEGSPQVIKEAIVCDLPIVSTTVGDVPWLLEGQHNAKLGKSNDDLVKGICEIFGQTEQPYCDTLKESVSNTIVCDKIITTYNALLLKNRGQ